jgi:hypothetical protein
MRALERGGLVVPTGARDEAFERASRDRSVSEVFGERIATVCGWMVPATSPTLRLTLPVPRSSARVSRTSPKFWL